MNSSKLFGVVAAAMGAVLADWGLHEILFATGMERSRIEGPSAAIYFSVVGTIVGLVSLAIKLRQSVLRTLILGFSVVGTFDLLILIAWLFNREPVYSFLPNFLRTNLELTSVTLIGLGAATLVRRLAPSTPKD